MTNRREFLRLISALSVFPTQAVEAVLQSGITSTGATKGLHQHHRFPVTIQMSPLPGQAAWKDLASQADAKSTVSTAIDQYIQHGFAGLEYPFQLGAELEEFILEYARKRGLFLTYNHTFDKGGVEMFGRTTPPAVSVYAPEYGHAVMDKLAPVLSKAKQLPGLSYLFCYQDEPFHVSATSFDRSPAALSEFRRQYGYDMPGDIEATQKHAKQWLDLLNFQSDTFPDGWRQIYKLVKQQLPDVKVILTHDSHSPFGAGVGSNEKVAMDDVFHWGADFADLVVFDIYPYMMFDFRYGEFGKIRKPRLSQMHFALAQLRNLTYCYGKELGFWFGTFNRKWFKEFMGPELKRESWAEAEICHTAVAHGANYLISGYKVPEDKAHWDTLGQSLSTLQDAMPELLECPKVKAKACFIFPRTQYLQLQQEYWNVAVAYEAFQQAFGELDCLHEDQVAKDGLHDYEIVVMFDVELLPEPVARQIADFVNAGGLVIADCVPCMDAFRNPMPLLQELFGVENSPVNRVARTGVFVPKLEKPRWFVEPTSGQDEDLAPGAIARGNAWGKEFYFRVVSPRSVKASTGSVLLTSDTGVPALMYRNSGKGHAYLLGFCMQDTCFATWKDEDAASRSALQDLLWSITQQAGVMPTVRSTNPQIEASLRANSTDAFVFVINHEANQPRTQVSVSMPRFVVKAVRSLTDGRNIEYRQVSGRIFFDLEVSRDKPQLLRLTSNP